MVPEIFVGISLVCPKGTQFDEIINMSQRNPPAQSNAIYLPAFPHLPSWLGTCFVDPGCVFKLNQNVSNPESSTWKSDSICAKASRSLPRASVKRLLSFRSDFNVVSSWDIWTFSAFSVALRENNLLMFFVVTQWLFLIEFHITMYFLSLSMSKAEFRSFSLLSLHAEKSINWGEPVGRIMKTYLRMTLSFSKSLIFSLAWCRDCLKEDDQLTQGNTPWRTGRAHLLSETYRFPLLFLQLPEQVVCLPAHGEVPIFSATWIEHCSMNRYSVTMKTSCSSPLEPSTGGRSLPFLSPAWSISTSDARSSWYLRSNLKKSIPSYTCFVEKQPGLSVTELQLHALCSLSEGNSVIQTIWRGSKSIQIIGEVETEFSRKTCNRIISMFSVTVCFWLCDTWKHSKLIILPGFSKSIYLGFQNWNLLLKVGFLYSRLLFDLKVSFSFI